MTLGQKKTKVRTALEVVQCVQHEVLTSYCQLHHKTLVVDFSFSGHTDKMDKDKGKDLECREV